MYVTVLDNKQWLLKEDLQDLLRILSQGKDEACVVGGAVRNALLGHPISDIDIATTVLPDEVMKRCDLAGFRAIPTRLDHGVVTLIRNATSYEVTTLRCDVATNGRYAKVSFGKDWRCDAMRRDFTMNALYAYPDGRVVDFCNGLEDLKKGIIRFIGDPEKRIKEDYLRILRFFRFFTFYGKGLPSQNCMQACADHKEHLSVLSFERIWMECKKIFLAPDPRPALLWMEKIKIFSQIFPSLGLGRKDALHALLKAEKDLLWPGDVLLRFCSFFPHHTTDSFSFLKKLNMKKSEKNQILAILRTAFIDSTVSKEQVGRLLYDWDYHACMNRLKQQVALSRWNSMLIDSDLYCKSQQQKMMELFLFVEQWQKPIFPIAAIDLFSLGVKESPFFGDLWKKLEKKWVASSFRETRESLLVHACCLLKGKER